MKTILSLFAAIIFSGLCIAEEKLPVDFPLTFSNSELNREYVKDQRKVVSYKTKLEYNEACEELARLLGKGWEKKELSEEAAETRQAFIRDPDIPIVGMDAYVNPQYPDLTVTIAAVRSPVEGTGFPYFITITIGPIQE